MHPTTLKMVAKLLAFLGILMIVGMVCVTLAWADTAQDPFAEADKVCSNVTLPHDGDCRRDTMEAIRRPTIPFGVMQVMLLLALAMIASWPIAARRERRELRRWGWI